MKQYEGTLRLDLSRKGKVYKRVEQKNTVTALVQDTFLDGNFGYLLDRSKASVMEYFDGCILTDKENNASLGMIAHDSEITAQAGNDTYTGLNYKRGSYVPLESHVFTDPSLGFTKIWRWDNAYGNGTINSVCLAPHETAIFDFQNGALPIDGNPPNKALGYSNLTTTDIDYASSLAHLNIIDYNTGKGYYVVVAEDATALYIDEFEVSCSSVRILGTPDTVVCQIGNRHSIPVSLPQPNNRGAMRIAMCYTGDAIHIIVFQNYTENSVEKVRLTDYKVLTSNLNEFVDPTPTPLIYSDVWLYTSPTWKDSDNNWILVKDWFIYNDTDNYLFGIGKEGGEDGTPAMLRFDLTSTDVRSYDLSFAPPIENIDWRGYDPVASILLDNGDFYKFHRANTALPNAYAYYYHNDKVYAVSNFTRMASSSALIAVNGGKNTIIQNMNGIGRLVLQLDSLFPYVSTVANLPEEVKKTYEFDMTLQYSVREVS